MKTWVREDWRDALWRHWSARLIALGSSIQMAMLTWPESALYLWSLLPVEARAIVPPRYALFIPWLCFALALVAKVIRQNPKRKDKEDAETNSVPAPCAE